MAHMVSGWELRVKVPAGKDLKPYSWRSYELRTKLRLGATHRGLSRVVGGTQSRIYYKINPGLICRLL